MNNQITDLFRISKRTVTDEGFLVVEDSILARSGIMEYAAGEVSVSDAPAGFLDNPLQAVKVFRSEEELFDSESMNSFRSKPITLQHPDKFVNASNFKGSSVGLTKDDVRQDGSHMRATLVVMDGEAIKRINAGTKELSLGYRADIRYAPGVTDTGEQYDAIMENIRGNHIAIVPRGRCGRECKISDNKNEEVKTVDNVSVVMDGIPYECPAQTAHAVSKLISKVDELEKTNKTLVVDHSNALEASKGDHKTALDKLQAKLDESESNVLKDSDLDKAVKERSAVVDAAKSIIEKFDPADLSNAEIKAAVVKDACKIDITDKSVDYIDARFDSLLESKKAGKKGYTDTLKDHATEGNDVNDEFAGMSYSQKKRAELMKANKEKKWGV